VGGGGQVLIRLPGVGLQQVQEANIDFVKFHTGEI
jgi:hypothetical protein